MRLRDYQIMSHKTEDPVVNEPFLPKATLLVGQSMEDTANSMVRIWDLAGNPVHGMNAEERESLEKEIDSLADLATVRVKRWLSGGVLL